MALLPFIFDDDDLLVRPRRHSGRLKDQHFGLGLAPDDVLTIVSKPLTLITPDYYRPWRRLAKKDLGSTVKEDKEKLEYRLDVQQFKPEEITVKTSDGFIIVEGKHEEKKDGEGYIARRFMRRYELPEDCPAERVESKLSSDGILTVTANKKRKASTERSIPIQHVGPERKKLKTDSENKENGTSMEE